MSGKLSGALSLSPVHLPHRVSLPWDDTMGSRVSYRVRGLPPGALGHLGWSHILAILPGAAEPDSF